MWLWAVLITALMGIILAIVLNLRSNKSPCVRHPAREMNDSARKETFC